MENSNWLIEEFCERVSALKDDGMAEDDAKMVVKSIMDAACGIITGERSLVDVIKDMEQIK